MRFSLLFLFACSSSTLVDVDANAASDAFVDASAPDVPAVDAWRDVASFDAGNDAGPPVETPELVRSLWCETDPDEALDMLSRYVACSWSEYYLPLSTLYLWWETGLLGSRNDQTLRGLSYSCEHWRCIGGATSCSEVYACQAAGDECLDGEQRCVGNVSQVCTRGRYSTLTDCGALDGFSCENEGDRAWCQSGDCRVGSGWDLQVGCEEDALVFCEGDAEEFRIPCATVRPGSACATVAPGGEVPVNYCGVPGASDAIYGREPVSCEGDTAVFESFYSGEIQIDCRAAGYSRCMVDFGCVF